MSVTTDDTIHEYYREMKSKLFGRGKLSDNTNSAVRTPTARFTLNRNFDLSMRYAAYKFLVEISENFGPFINPIRLENECINLTVAFEKIFDDEGREFRSLILSDEQYHDIFKRYDVTMIKVENFPGSVDVLGKPKPSNSKFQLFLVDKMGRPSVPSVPSP